MYEKLKECPVCKHEEFSNFLICSDHLLTDESFAIVQCANCGLKFTNPRPTPDNIDRYYQSNEYASHQSKSLTLTDHIYNLVRKFTLKKKLGLVNSVAEQRGNLLDVGCGTGLFLKTCKAGGWETTGVETNVKARTIAISNNCGEIHDHVANLQGKMKFRIITLWHVLEHLHDLNGSMELFRRLLKKDGKLIIAVPNSNSWDCHHYGDMWGAYDVPRHLYHFNQLTINYLAKQCKFRVQHVVPMKLDAFYVSLLSEKYLHGSNRFIRAIKSGLKSNQWAKRNQNNYSSLIYILSKK
ncbi:MAG: class I SAM-dependent methyltransferase [Bacteroidetes bacterium]|nr:class I SAM-dependent methyltransferase [Bacteroidota bacterium]MDA1119006.1 class I SAM-dependent methyltransferase [Bacteroidota bacterium]